MCTLGKHLTIEVWTQSPFNYFHLKFELAKCININWLFLLIMSIWLRMMKLLLLMTYTEKANYFLNSVHFYLESQQGKNMICKYFAITLQAYRTLSSYEWFRVIAILFPCTGHANLWVLNPTTDCRSPGLSCRFQRWRIKARSDQSQFLAVTLKGVVINVSVFYTQPGFCI